MTPHDVPNHQNNTKKGTNISQTHKIFLKNFQMIKANLIK